jgi:N-acyl-D-amino-acid deacylase
MRSEGDALLEGLDELLEIGQRAQVRTELYHFKAAGMDNWPKMARAIERIEHARASGQQVTADMYPYVAGATGLMASIPPKYHDGGPEELQKRLADPAIRTQMAADIRQPSKDWENLYLGCGDGSGVLFFKDLADGTPARGRRLSEVAADLGLDHVDALLEIVARDLSVGVAYFDIDEDNVRLGLQQEWVSVGSDAEAFPATPPWTDRPAHPRTFGAFARFLGRYGRDQGLFSLTEGVRRMTSLPAGNFRLRDRGRLVPGAFADIAVFDADAFIDHATFAEPHQYATGMRHVLVNGVPVLRDEKITGAAAGRHLRRGA